MVGSHERYKGNSQFLCLLITILQKPNDRGNTTLSLKVTLVLRW